jgi:type I restriction enzyme R subunit
MQKLGKIKEAGDCVNLNETTRTRFEMMARNVFRKFKALYPEEQVKPYVKKHNAIEAIYGLLNQKTKTADVIEVMMQLQEVVSGSILVKDQVAEPKEEVYVDLSRLDFDKLKAAFEKAPRKNTLTYDLQQAIEKKLEQMLKENPLRLEFYERYKEIIDEYNNGKSLENTERAFNKLTDFLASLSEEEQRAVRENLEDQETLAIFDLLREGKELGPKEKKEVKKVAQQTLEKLKAEKLKIERWRESRQITAQVKGMIYDNLLWLPQEVYSDEEVSLKTVSVYQHIYTNYFGGGKSVYQRSA